MRSWPQSGVLLASLTLLATLLFAEHAKAHGLGAECKLYADRVEIEAYYDDDTPARNVPIRIEDEQKQIIDEGRTDGEGRWQLARPRPGQYLVVVDAGGGHRTQVRFIVPVSAAPNAVTISAGPTRAEFTQFPWLKLALGLGTLASLSLAFLLSRRLGRQTSGPTP